MYLRYYNRIVIGNLFNGVANIAFQLSKYSFVKSAIIESWKCLYSISGEVVDRFQAIFHEFLPKHEGEEAAGRPNKPRASTEHEMLDALRHVPTLLGRRLTEVQGWGTVHHRPIEAEVLFFSGILLQYLEDEDGELLHANFETDSRRSRHSNTYQYHRQLQRTGIMNDQSVEYFQLALAIYPDHTKSLLALANVYYERYLLEVQEKVILKPNTFENQMETLQDNLSTAATTQSQLTSTMAADEIERRERDMERSLFLKSMTSKNLALARYYVQRAIISNDKHPDAW
jgi:hypothetical protein